MAIFIVKSVYSMKKWKNEIIRLDMKLVWNNTPLLQNVKEEGIWSLKYDWEYDM